jgi:hypothetical protein
MADINGFDAEQVEPNVDFGAVPAGRYEVMMTESEWQDNSRGTGRFLKLTFQILEGEFKGKPLWDRLNLDNPSEKAVQIAKGSLSAICRAVGVTRPKDTNELHGIPLIVRVDKEEYEPGKWSNPVKAYYPKKAQEETKKLETAGASPAAKPASAPWAKVK